MRDDKEDGVQGYKGRTAGGLSLIHISVPQAALRFVASHKEITVTLAGCTTKEHIDDAVKAVEHLEEMPSKEIAREYEGKGCLLYTARCV